MSLQAERHCIWILSCRRRSKLLGKRRRRKKGEVMKVLLLFPPSWHPSQPYLSLPSLTAFLRENGVSNVLQRDLNIELLDILLTRKKCLEFYQKIINKLKDIDRDSKYYEENQEKRLILVNALEIIPEMADKVERAKNVLRTDDFYDLEKYVDSVNIINDSLRCMSALYYPSLMPAVNNDMRYSVYSSKEIFMALDDQEENIFLNLYKEHILPSILEYSPDLLGISITNTSQIIPGLTLAKLVKKQNETIYITIGGSVFTKLIENIKNIDGLFSIVDSFIVFEGEHALLELVTQIDREKDFKKVPN